MRRNALRGVRARLKLNGTQVLCDLTNVEQGGFSRSKLRLLSTEGCDGALEGWRGDGFLLRGKAPHKTSQIDLGL